MAIFKRFTFLFLVSLISITFSSAVFAGDREFCSKDNWSGNDKVSFNELRESTVSATNVVSVDGKKNGGIRVIGENRSDVLVRACIQAWAKTEGVAQSTVKSIQIETGSVIQASDSSAENWSVSFEIRVPHLSNLKLTAHNGGISIDSVRGNLDFETKNGGVKLNAVGGNVKGRTQNGGINISLDGSSWNGNGLDVETTNGGIKLELSKNYSANIETGTANGGFSTDFPELSVNKDNKENRWTRNKRISASINGGGATIRVVTTNGGVKIGSLEK